MKEQLCNALMELKSARRIIKILQEDIDKFNASGATNTAKPIQNSEFSVCDPPEGNWLPIFHNYNRKTKKPVRSVSCHKQQNIVISNSFTPLTNLHDSSVLTTSDSLHKPSFHKTSFYKNPRNSVMKKQKVVLIGDSHIRGCSEKISNLLGDLYSVTGITKPHANLKVITSPSNFQTEKYSVSDVVVICGGNMDVGSKIGLWHLTHFVKTTNNTNIIFLDVPHHFDFDVTSCVNKEVTVFNRMLQRVIKPHQHIQTQNMSVNRTHFIRHGMHMNSLGKTWITEETAKKGQHSFSLEQVNSPIPLYWKVLSDHSTSQSKDLQSLVTEDTRQHNNHFCTLNESRNLNIVGVTYNAAQVQYSSHERSARRKIPAHRNDDFLWF
jgi:hypothetical protein